MLHAISDGLPTPPTTLRACMCACWSGASHAAIQTNADLQALIDAGKGDVREAVVKIRLEQPGAGWTTLFWIFAGR